MFYKFHNDVTYVLCNITFEILKILKASIKDRIIFKIPCSAIRRDIKKMFCSGTEWSKNIKIVIDFFNDLNRLN